MIFLQSSTQYAFDHICMEKARYKFLIIIVIIIIIKDRSRDSKRVY